MYSIRRNQSKFIFNKINVFKIFIKNDLDFINNTQSNKIYRFKNIRIYEIIYGKIISVYRIGIQALIIIKKVPAHTSECPRRLRVERLGADFYRNF